MRLGDNEGIKLFSVKGWSRLKVLDLSFCGVEEVPEFIEQSYSLELIDLRNGKFEKLPSNWRCLSLRILNLSGSRITELPEKIGASRHL